MILPHLKISNIHFYVHYHFRFKALIKHPILMWPFVDLFACLCGVGMIESMLEPHLRESGASTLTIGLSFLGFGCCYSVGNMVFGRVRIEIDRLIFLVRERFNHSALQNVF